MPELTDTSNNDDRELNELLNEADRRKARDDRKFFVWNFLRTFDPRPEAYPHDLDFELYGFQEGFIEDVYEAIINGHDLFIEKSRDMGASWCVLAVIFWCWIFKPGFQALLGSRVEEYVDNGEVDSLFGKLEYFCRSIKDKKILPKGFDINKHKRYMHLSNPDNGNAILGGAASKNFARAGRYSVVMFDEFGFWAHARQSWTAASQSARCRIAITTPPDEPSYAKVIRFSGKIKVITLHWSLHPHKDQKWYEGEKARLLPDELLHEVDISWEYSAKSRPYPESDNLVFGDYPYDPTVPLYKSIDLGLDGVAVGWYQPVRNSDWWTLVECFEKADEMIDWFYPIFGLPIESGRFNYTDDELEFIEQVKFWRKDAIYFGDPSGKQRHIESKESAYQRLQRRGIYVQSNSKDNDWITRRDATKSLLPKLRVNDTPRTRWWHECMKLAHYPKRSEESQSTTPVTLPVHDFTSHHRTQTEFFSVNYKTYAGIIGGGVPGGKGRPREYDSSGRLLS